MKASVMDTTLSYSVRSALPDPSAYWTSKRDTVLFVLVSDATLQCWPQVVLGHLATGIYMPSEVLKCFGVVISYGTSRRMKVRTENATIPTDAPFLNAPPSHIGFFSIL